MKPKGDQLSFPDKARKIGVNPDGLTRQQLMRVVRLRFIEAYNGGGASGLISPQTVSKGPRRISSECERRGPRLYASASLQAKLEQKEHSKRRKGAAISRCWSNRDAVTAIWKGGSSSRSLATSTAGPICSGRSTREPSKPSWTWRTSVLRKQQTTRSNWSPKEHDGAFYLRKI